MPAYNLLGYQNPYINNYGNYYPASYSYMQTPYMQNQNAGNSVMQQPQLNSSANIIWINNEKEAETYPVAPNNAVTLWNASEPVVYLKQADATGKPTLKIFDLVERASANTSETPALEYATKAELSATLQAMNDLTSAMGNLRNDINAMKEDMYGLAGKKKTVRKVETDSDE